MSIDQFTKKRCLLTGFVPQNRVGARQADEGSEDSEDEHIAGLQMEVEKRNYWNKKIGLKHPEAKPQDTSIKVKVNVSPRPQGGGGAMMEEMMKQIKELLEGRRKPGTDPRLSASRVRSRDILHQPALQRCPYGENDRKRKINGRLEGVIHGGKQIPPVGSCQGIIHANVSESLEVL